VLYGSIAGYSQVTGSFNMDSDCGGLGIEGSILCCRHPAGPTTRKRILSVCEFARDASRAIATPELSTACPLFGSLLVVYLPVLRGDPGVVPGLDWRKGRGGIGPAGHIPIRGLEGRQSLGLVTPQRPLLWSPKVLATRT
jgi:hypothetical protein